MIRALHGAFGSPADWEQFATLAAPLLVRADDLWADDHALTLDEWASQFNRSAERQDPTFLLGYSLGGRLALHALIARPDLWRGAVIVSAHPGLRTDGERQARRVRDNEWLRLLDSAEWPDFWRAWISQPVLASAQPRPAPAEIPNARRGLEAWSLSEQQDLTPLLHGISCPVQWVTGRADSTYTALAASAAGMIPSARHEVVENAGHRAPWDAPAEFARLVGGFVESLAGTTP